MEERFDEKKFAKEYYLRNKEKIKERSRTWYFEHKDYVLKQSHEYYLKHKGEPKKGGTLTKCLTCGSEFKIFPYQEKHGIGKFCSRKCVPKEYLVKRWIGHIKVNHIFKYKRKRFSKKHRINLLIKRRKIYHEKNRILLTKEQKLGHKRFWNKRYKLRKKGIKGSHTFQDWILLKSYYGNMCLCCKKTEPEIKLSQDHIIPISKGGSDDIENIQPLCTRCNTSKYTKTINYILMKGGAYLIE